MQCGNKSASPMTSHGNFDLVVVGAGPGGLACAAAFIAAFGPSARVKVFESYKNFRPQGSGVLMQPNVQHALEALNPNLFAECKAHGLPFTTNGTIYDEQGNEFKVAAPAIHAQMEQGKAERAVLDEKYGKRPFTLGWHEIRQLLYKSLPEGTVAFDTQVTHYTESADGVTVHFDRNQPAVSAKILVGADGFFSKIRQLCLDDGPPQFTGRVMWRARLGWQEGMPPPGEFRLWKMPGAVGPTTQAARIFQMGTLEETKDQSWSWILGCPVNLVKQAGVDFDPNARGIKSVQGDASSGTALENVIKVFSHFSPAIMDIVKSTDPSTVTQHGLYVRPLGKSAAPQAAISTPPAAPHTPQQTPTTPAASTQIASSSGKSDVKSTSDHALPAHNPDQTIRAGPLKARRDLQQDSASAEHASREVSQQASADAASPHSKSDQNSVSSDGRTPPSSYQQGSASAAHQPVDLLTPSQSVPAVSQPEVSQPTSSMQTVQQPRQETAQQSKPDATQPQAVPGQETQPAEEFAGGWGKGRVTLLGDAAHATIPNGQGLALAIEDAVVLAWHLRRQGIAQPGLRSYEEERLPRVKTINIKGTDQASTADRERYLYKPTFRPLWRAEDDPSAKICIKDFEPWES